MPLYEYKCPSCGNKIDIILSLEERSKSVPVCTKCGTVLQKLFSAPAYFDLRGSGFYKTDFKGK